MQTVTEHTKFIFHHHARVARGVDDNVVWHYDSAMGNGTSILEQDNITNLWSVDFVRVCSEPIQVPLSRPVEMPLHRVRTRVQVCRQQAERLVDTNKNHCAVNATLPAFDKALMKVWRVEPLLRRVCNRFPDVQF